MVKGTPGGNDNHRPVPVLRANTYFGLVIGGRSLVWCKGNRTNQDRLRSIRTKRAAARNAKTLSMVISKQLEGGL